LLFASLASRAGTTSNRPSTARNYCTLWIASNSIGGNNAGSTGVAGLSVKGEPR
jgi:hypothetical protein